MSKQELEIVEDNEDGIDILDAVLETASVVTGFITGGAVVYGLDKVIPAARNTMETVFRTVGIGSGGIVAQWLTSSAVSEDAKDVKRIISGVHGMASSAGSKLLGGDNEE